MISKLLKPYDSRKLLRVIAQSANFKLLNRILAEIVVNS